MQMSDLKVDKVRFYCYNNNMTNVLNIHHIKNYFYCCLDKLSKSSFDLIYSHTQQLLGNGIKHFFIS
jgi:DNA polymerase elongation subunit (family B)